MRRRSASDLGACERLARAVHATDGYPPYIPHDDFTRFLDPPEAVDAWVATRGVAVVGHVALHRTSSVPVMDLAVDELGLGATQLVVVARLLVAPEERRHGVGQLLLARATSKAHDLGQQPILDVATQFTAVVSLYERMAWRRLGTLTVTFPDGFTIDEFVYCAPLGAVAPCPDDRA